VEKKTFSRIGFGAMTGFLASIFLQFAYLFLFPYEYLSASADTIVTYLVIYLPYILIVWLFVRGLPEYPRVSGEAVRGGAAVVLVLAVLLVDLGTSDIFYYIGSYVDEVFSWIIHGGYAPSALFEDYTEEGFNWGLFFVICLMGPVCEEILFRGLILKKLLPFGDACAIIVSGVMFGMFHGNFIQMFYAATGGLLLGYVYVRTDSLLASIALHSLGNIMTYLVDFLYLLGLNDTQVARFAGGFTFGTWLAAAALIAWHCKRLKLNGPRVQFTRPVGPRLVCSSAGMIAYAAVVVLSSIYYII